MPVSYSLIEFLSFNIFRVAICLVLGINRITDLLYWHKLLIATFKYRVY